MYGDIFVVEKGVQENLVIQRSCIDFVVKLQFVGKMSTDLNKLRWFRLTKERLLCIELYFK